MILFSTARSEAGLKLCPLYTDNQNPGSQQHRQDGGNILNVDNNVSKVY